MSIIKPLTLEELKEIQAKILFSRTDKVTKIANGSVLNGVMFGNAKTGQKALTNIAIAQAHYFPDASYGQYLDDIAQQYGIPGRFGALGSSLYVRVVAAPGTVYTQGSHQVTGTAGITFDLDETVTVGDAGFAYIKVSSVEVGENTNIDPFTLNTLTNPPAGHEYVTNEYRGFGGREVESDNSFRNRIKSLYNIASIGTLERLTQALINDNPNVLRLFNHGSDGAGKIELAVVSQNGADFTGQELIDLLTKHSEFLSMSEINLDWVTTVGVVMKNPDWYPIDVGFRCQLESGYNADEVRKQVQININKYIDYRIWGAGQKVEWDDLLGIVKSTEGIRYVLDNTFVPGQDLNPGVAQLPRIRGFEMRDIDGNIISTGGNDLNPVYYPNDLDFFYIRSVLRTL
jgi:uncharacterized phage protein gp47/JayE